MPKTIRTAASVLPGSDVSVSLESGRIVISKVAGGIKTDRRELLRTAAAKLRKTIAALVIERGRFQKFYDRRIENHGNGNE